MPQLNAARPSAAIQPTNIKILGHIHEGMTKDALLIAWDKPTNIQKSFNLDHDYLVYSYDGEMCAYTFQSCTVRVESGKVTQFFNVKPDYAEYD